MKTKSEKCIRTSYLDKKAWVIIAMVIVAVCGFLFYPRSFGSLVKLEKCEMKAMIISLGGGKSDNNTSKISPEVSEQVLNLFHKFKYIKEWTTTAKSYSEGTLVLISIYAEDEYYCIQLISNGDMIFRNENYKVVGGGALFDEVYALIAADAYS